jgi:prepilin peptidase CpaA
MEVSIKLIVMLTLLALAAYFDLSQRRIPNFLTFPVILWGLISYITSGGFHGLLFSLSGLTVGIAVFLIPFALGGMGAGDVKLMGAIGALAGVGFVTTAAIYAALWGGVLAVVYLVANKRLLGTLKKVFGFVLRPILTLLAMRLRNPALLQLTDSFTLPAGTEEKPVYIPYGVAISLGALLALTNAGAYLQIL